MTLESFVIRIYRRPGRTGRGMVGVVEGEGTAGQAFTSAEELWELLVRGTRRAPGSGRSRVRPAQRQEEKLGAPRAPDD